jgi:glycosyltransferase involved in cell wall biosynthesis
MIMNYYRAMDRERFQFDFLINRREKGVFEDEILRLGGRIFRMCELYPWKFGQYKQELREFLVAHPEYKAIHSHLEERSYLALKVAREMEIPVRIAHAHNVYPLSLNPKTVFRQYFRYKVRGVATERFSCSKHAAKWLFGENAKWTFIPNAISPERFKFDEKRREILRKKYKTTPETVVLGFVGRMTEQKNPEFVIRVFQGYKKRNPNVRLFMVGKGDLSAVLQDKYHDVDFIPPVENIEDFYLIFDILLLPSRYEGLGMVAVEAGASGLPTLASTEVPKEANVLGNIEFLTTESSAEWADILGGKSLARREIRKKDFGEYDIAVAVKKLEKIYEDFARL